MTYQNTEIEDKIDILKHIHQVQRDEVLFRREREYRVFIWSSTILWALIGALLITKPTESVVWESYGYWGKAVASVAVVVLVVYSVKWQFRNSKLGGQNARVIAHINKLLHCIYEGYFEPEENSALFPREWADYGRREISLRTRLFAANYVSATALLGILALIMTWVP